MFCQYFHLTYHPILSPKTTKYEQIWQNFFFSLCPSMRKTLPERIMIMIIWIYISMIHCAILNINFPNVSFIHNLLLAISIHITFFQQKDNVKWNFKNSVLSWVLNTKPKKVFFIIFKKKSGNWVNVEYFWSEK